MHASFYFQSLFMGHKIFFLLFFSPHLERAAGSYICRGQQEYEVDESLEIYQFYTYHGSTIVNKAITQIDTNNSLMLDLHRRDGYI